MRRMMTTAIVALSAVVGAPATASAGAGAAPTNSQGRTVDVSASLQGRYNDGRSGWQNPCSDPYPEFRDARSSADAGPTRGATRIGADGVREVLWEAWCEDPATGLRDPENLQTFWIADPDPADLVPAVFARVAEYLDPPTVEWPNMSPEHGWLFVNVPMDFRVNNLGAVTVTATVTNIVGTATASVTATPDRVVFASGEGGGAECSAADASAAYANGMTDACEYTYESSSTVRGGAAFGSRTTVYWAITSNPADGSLPAELDTWSEQSLVVSEVQGVVTCIGSDC